MVLEVEEEQSQEEGERSSELEEGHDLADGEALKMELSLNSLTGFGSNHTMKIRGRLSDLTVIILIDSGATHNFIAKELVRKAPLMVDEVAEYTVSVGDGHKIKRKHRCSNIKFKIQELEVVETLYLFPLEGVDVALGIEWLKSLGEVKVNWSQLTMKIGNKHDRTCLRGDPTLSKHQATLKNMMRPMQRKEDSYLIEYHGLVNDEECTTEVAPEVQTLLDRFLMVCQPIEGLPSPKTKDHAIVIQQGAHPPNIRPYQYPHLQKNEIENTMRDMLRAGIIQPRTSPYSSPVLLVKRKKDGSWRFCVDYRALN